MKPSGIRFLRSDDPSCRRFLSGLRLRGTRPPVEIEKQVTEIIHMIREGGHAALLTMAVKWDGLPAHCRSVEISSRKMKSASSRVSKRRRSAMEVAAHRIRAFHERRALRPWLTVDPLGCILGQLVQPLDRVGVYVPGGRASYPSSVLMNAIPARIAGVREIIMCCPLDWDDPNPEVLAAAEIAQVDRVFCVGGAHAIAAMAYGAGEIPAVDKIVGPGNIYVATAKRMVFGDVGIDMIAGPTEIAIVADGTVEPKWAAMDMLSQAEHDEMASATLFTPSESYAKGAIEALMEELPKMRRRDIAEASLARNGAVVVTSSLDEALELASYLAPEHLELLMERPWESLHKVRNAGAIFLGPWSAESVGDYMTGPNHVLPTGGTARFSSPLSVEDFIRRPNVIQVSREALEELLPGVIEFAHMEGLDAHGRSAACRLGGDT
jgi:histidinol dehydrogenase